MTNHKYEEFEKKHGNLIRFLSLIMMLISILSIAPFYNQVERASVNLRQELHKEDDAKVETKVVTVTNVSLQPIRKNLINHDRDYGATIQTEEYKEPIFIGEVGEALQVQAGDRVELSAIFEPDNIRYVQDVKIIETN